MFGHTWCAAPRDNRALKVPEAHVMVRAKVLLQRCKLKFICVCLWRTVSTGHYSCWEPLFWQSISHLTVSVCVSVQLNWVWEPITYHPVTVIVSQCHKMKNRDHLVLFSFSNLFFPNFSASSWMSWFSGPRFSCATFVQLWTCFMALAVTSDLLFWWVSC